MEGVGTAREKTTPSRRSPPVRPTVAGPKDPQKSRITNGALLPGIDGRSAWVRRCKDLLAEHVADLGGVDNTSAAERSIVRRAVTLTVELERLEKKFALAGEALAGDLDTYQRVSNTLRRLLESVGLQRRARDVSTPTLGDLLREDLAQQQAMNERENALP